MKAESLIQETIDFMPDLEGRTPQEAYEAGVRAAFALIRAVTFGDSVAATFDTLEETEAYVIERSERSES